MGPSSWGQRRPPNPALCGTPNQTSPYEPQLLQILLALTKSGVVALYKTRKSSAPMVVSNVTLGFVACPLHRGTNRASDSLRLRLRPPQQPAPQRPQARCRATVGCGTRADNSCRLRPGGGIYGSWAGREELWYGTVVPRRCTTGGFSAATAAASGARLGALQRCANGCRCPYRSAFVAAAAAAAAAAARRPHPSRTHGRHYTAASSERA